MLVSPGQRVSAGQPLAVLEDGGTSSSAVLQARYDVSSALVDLHQKQTSDPLKGVPATPQELAAARYAVTSAQARLAQLLGPRRPADVAAARLELRKSQTDLETLFGGRDADRASALGIAKQTLELAQQRLEKLLAPPNPADVAAVELEVKRAESDLADLQRQRNPSATPEQLAAGRKAVEAAQLKLARVLAPPPAADIAAAKLEIVRADADLRRLRAGPSATAITSARQAVALARARLSQLLGPPLHAEVTVVRLDLRKAVADLGVLKRRGGPATSFDVELARLKVEAARAKLALALYASKQLIVRAPAAGTVTDVLTVAGAPVDGSTPIATVTALDSLAVNVQLSEFDVARVRAGLAATVNVDSLGGKSFEGRVLFVGLTGVDSGGVVTFPVRVGLKRIASLRPGMNVSVHIVVARRRNVVRVPLEAVSRNTSGRPVVTVVELSGRRITRRVRLGLSNNKEVAVVGLRAGQRVIIPGNQGG